MGFEFRPCEFEMDYEAYMRFLLQHDSELNLPYAFGMKFSFIGSPLFLGKAMLVFAEEPYEVVGAAGFVYGTGAHGYEDREVCQVEVACIRPEYRSVTLFRDGLKALVDLIRASNPDVQRLQFWTKADHGRLDRLFAKFGALPGATRSDVNDLTCYVVPFPALEQYCRRMYRHNE